MKHGLRWFALALVLVSAVACDLRREDFGRVEAATQAFAARWSQRVAELTQRHDQLTQRAQALPAGAAGVADLQSRLAAMKADLDALTQKVDASKEEAVGKVQERRSRLAEEAIARNTRDLQTATATIDGSLAEIEQQIVALEQTQAATQDAAPAAPASLTDPAFPRSTATADIDGIAFVAGTAQLDLRAPTTRPALDQLVAFASTCDQLRFSLIGHTARDGDERVNTRLSKAQADAVRVHLEGAGVAAAKIAQVGGAGGEQPRAPEPAPGSPEEKAMKTEELAAIRAQNRRISVQVLTPCPTPS